MASGRGGNWKAHHRRWLKFVRATVRAMEDAKAIPLGPSRERMHAPAAKKTSGRALRVVICSPHPDDEALVGGLPLRLQNESGARVTNCAITLGSDETQRKRRLRELKSSCAALGFRLVVANSPRGFDRVRLETRRKHPAEWAKMVHTLSELFDKERPDLVFTPHAEDENATHIGTHYLVADALQKYLRQSGRSPLPVIETEYWRPQASPNLMVGISPEDEATLITATAEHVGEVRRNPYHLRHPGRMIDNVRRGAEMVGQAGGPAPDFPFAELYRFRLLTPRGWITPRVGSCILGADEKIDWDKLVAHFAVKG